MVFNPLADPKGRAFGGVWGNAPQTASKRSAKGELKNSPVDCFLRGNALQERAFPYKIYIFCKLKIAQKSPSFKRDFFVSTK